MTTTNHSPRRRPHDAESDQVDTVTVRCNACQQTTATFDAPGLRGIGEARIYRAVAPLAAQRGWAVRKFEGADELVCPLCLDRERNVDRFPPFSGTGCRCPKCQGGPVSARYTRVGGEHLERKCGVCGFGWNEAVAAVIRRPWWKLWGRRK